MTASRALPLAALAATLLVAGTAPAGAQGRVQILPCKLTVMIVPRAGAPTVLRVSPSVRAKILRRLPWRRAGIVADVYGTTGIWFQVRNLRTGTGRPLGPRSRGPKADNPAGGWIHGSRLAIRLKDAGGRSAGLYEEPAARAKLMLRMGRQRGRRQGVLMACRGGWARLRLGPVIGWVPPRHQCARPYGRC